MSALKRVKSSLTINEVANAAGVSRATVSRVFSHPHLLNADTAEHVRKVAAKLGYIPNQTARALSTGRTGNIALIVPDIENPFFSAVIRRAQARAWELGYAMFIGDTNETPKMEDVLLAKLAPQVEGFILASPRLSKRQVEDHSARRPLVLINRDISSIPRILVDAANGYSLAVDHLADLGHVSIAYLPGPAVSWSDRQRKNAVLRTAARRGLTVKFVAIDKPTYLAGKSCADDLLRTGATAALAFDDVVAQGAMSGLAERGCVVPTDMSIVGCDGVLASIAYPPLTSIEAKCGDVGEIGVDLLMDHIIGKVTVQKIVMPTELVLRSTTSVPAGIAVSRKRGGASESAIGKEQLL